MGLLQLLGGRGEEHSSLWGAWVGDHCSSWRKGEGTRQLLGGRLLVPRGKVEPLQVLSGRVGRPLQLLVRGARGGTLQLPQEGCRSWGAEEGDHCSSWREGRGTLQLGGVGYRFRGAKSGPLQVLEGELGSTASPGGGGEAHRAFWGSATGGPEERSPGHCRSRGEASWGAAAASGGGLQVLGGRGGGPPQFLGRRGRNTAAWGSARVLRGRGGRGGGAREGTLQLPQAGCSSRGQSGGPALQLGVRGGQRRGAGDRRGRRAGAAARPGGPRGEPGRPRARLAHR